MREEPGTQIEAEDIDSKIAQLMAPENGKTGKKKRKFFEYRKKGKWSRKKKICVVAVCGVLLLFGVTRITGGKKQAALPVAVTTLEKKDLQEKLSLTGPVSGTDSVDVVSNLHAEITEIHVKEGDTVAKGQVLAVLDRTDLEREVKIAENACERARVNKQEKDKEAALGYEKAVQDFQKANLDHNRNSQLFTVGDLSQMELEQSAAALNDARRQMESYTVENGKGVADASYALEVENADLELEKKREELENTQITSSIDGTVVRVNSKVGQFADKVEDDKPMFSIENLEQLELELKVSEYSIGKVQVGQKAVISADILNGKTVEGEVVKISPTGEEKGGGSTERVVPAIIRIDDPEHRLIAGITARAEVLIKEAKDAFTVPVSAVWDEDGTSYIMAVKDGKIHRIPVTTGVDADVEIEVIPAEGETLEEGMQIVTAPGAEFFEGMPVTAIQ